MNDLRFAFRQFAKARGFTAVAVLTLALGIGATTALFSVVYGVLISPYPYAKSDEIWAPRIIDAKTGRGTGFRVGDYLEMAKLPGIATAMATAGDQFLMRSEPTPEFLGGVRLTGSAFEFLGVPAVIGRGFAPTDIKPNGEGEPVTVLSYRLWQRLFNGDPSALGRTLILNDQPHVIIGVMPPRFGWYGDDGLWAPLSTTDRQRGVNPILRLKPGVTKEVAEQQLLELFQRLAQETPARFPKDGFTVRLTNYLDMTVASGGTKNNLDLLSYAVGCLLLIACANVANLQLARGAARSREIAIRLALGAGRARLVRQLLTESVVLSLLGGVLGVAFAFALTKIIVLLLPPFGVPNEARVTLNSYVLVFSVAVSLASGILFGLMPGLQCTRPDLNEALKDGGHAAGSGSGASGNRTRAVLVVVEVALSLVLLVGASLAVRGFVELYRLDPGYRTEHMLLLRVPLPPTRYRTDEQRNAFARDLLERVQAKPGVIAAAIGAPPYFEGASAYTVAGQPKPDGASLAVNYVSADYRSALGLGLRSGRDLSAQEVMRGDAVALISEAARKLWPANVDPVGRVLHLDSVPAATVAGPAPVPNAGRDVTIVGVFSDARNYATADARKEPQPMVLVPCTLRGATRATFLVRTHGEPLGLINTVREEVHALDKELALFRPIAVEEILDQQMQAPRFSVALYGGLAGIALALAAAGIYSVLSYGVAQRTREFGVRMALGAGRGDILRLVIGAGGRLLAIGLAVGIAASIALTQVVKSEVFLVPLLDPLALAAASLLLSLVALFGCYIPARRATKVDPMVALRCE